MGRTDVIPRDRSKEEPDTKRPLEGHRSTRLLVESESDVVHVWGYTRVVDRDRPSSVFRSSIKCRSLQPSFYRPSFVPLLQILFSVHVPRGSVRYSNVTQVV